MLKRNLIISIISILVISIGLAAAQDEAQCDEGFRLFEHAAGETCIPENPERIVTLTDQNGLLPLLELGVRPVGSAGRLIEEDNTTVFRRVEGYDTEGIVGVGDFLAPNIEAILELEPDLIVGYEFNDSEIYDELSAIAPTVYIQIFNRPLDEALMDFAELVGETETAEELAEAYDERVEALLGELGDDADNITVSVITPAGNAGEFWNAADGQALGTVMDDLDFNRPEPETVEQEAPYSIETLNLHEADVMLIVDFSGDLINDPIVQEFIESSLFGTLDVAQAEQVYVIDGSQSVGAAWGKMNVFLDALEEILLDPDLNIDIVEEPEVEANPEIDTTEEADS
ncbi:MAG: ABC transporter substrate-binding protein [Anaerolineae bacterium]